MTEEALLINNIFSFLTLLSNVFLLFLIFIFLSRKKTWASKFLRLLKKYSYFLAFLLSFSAFVGSLVYSEFIGFEPCLLCWVQRIFLFPLPFIFAVALIKKERVLADYVLTLSITGGLIALYQSLIQWGFKAPVLTTCTEIAGDCAIVYFTNFGYITLPFMAFSVFALVAIIMIADKIPYDSLSSGK